MPEFERIAEDPFLQKLNESGHNWVILTDMEDEPRLILDADGFLRAALFDKNHDLDPYQFCHRPLIVRDSSTPVGDIIPYLKAATLEDEHHDGEIERDVVLVWNENEKRIITGADILGRLFKGIGHKENEPSRVDSHGIKEILSSGISEKTVSSEE